MACETGERNQSWPWGPLGCRSGAHIAGYGYFSGNLLTSRALLGTSGDMYVLMSTAPKAVSRVSLVTIQNWKCLGFEIVIFRTWHPFQNLGNASSDNLTSVKWNRHCAQLPKEPFQEDSLEEKFCSGNIYWNCWRMYDAAITPFLLSTIYYPPDQLYGPHCWSWEGRKTQHLPSFLEIGRNIFLEFLRRPCVPLFRVIKNTCCGR